MSADRFEDYRSAVAAMLPRPLSDLDERETAEFNELVRCSSVARVAMRRRCGLARQGEAVAPDRDSIAAGVILNHMGRL